MVPSSEAIIYQNIKIVNLDYRTGFEPVYQCFADIVVKPLRQRYIKEEFNLLI